MPAIPVVPMDDSTQESAAQILAEAFVDDPMFTTHYPSMEQRRAALGPSFRSLVRQTSDHGLADLADDGTGVALWIRPEGGDIGIAAAVRYGYLRVATAGGITGGLGVLRLQGRVGRAHHDLMGDLPHGYLIGLGVRPADQGRGVGSALLTRGCSRLDMLGLAGYLETHVARNVDLYRRHGFEVQKTLTNTGFHTWCMIRPA